MQHTLDNPVWHALIGPQAKLAVGQGRARHYPRDIAPFAAIAEATAEAYADLAVELPAGLEARLFRPADEPNPAGWETISTRPIIQMIAENIVAPAGIMQDDPTTLGEADALDMLDLAELA